MTGFKRRFTDAEFMELYKRGLTDKAISVILGVTRSAITQRRYLLRLMPNYVRVDSNPEQNYQNLRDAKNSYTKRDRANQSQKYKNYDHAKYLKLKQTKKRVYINRKKSIWVDPSSVANEPTKKEQP